MNAENISTVLDELALRFGATGAHLWGELVRYEVLDATVGLASLLFLLVLAVVGAMVVFRYSPPALRGDRDVLDALKIVSVAAISALLFILVLWGPTAVVTILAPEAAVLRGLLP